MPERAPLVVLAHLLLARAPSASTHKMTVTVTLKGCANGLGLGLSSKNVITQLDAGSPAANSGALELGDRIVAADGIKLKVRLFKGNTKLREVLRTADTHVLEVRPKGERGIFAGVLRRPRGRAPRNGPAAERAPPKHTPKGRGAKATSPAQWVMTAESSQGGQMKSALAGMASTPAHTQPAAPHAPATRERPAGRIPRAQREQLRAAQREPLRAANAAAIAHEVAAADKVAAEADVAVMIVQDMFQREEAATAKVRTPSKHRK